MPVVQSALGLEGTREMRVSATDTADAHGNPGLDAFASPALVGLVERAAMAALEDLLVPGEQTVGSVIELVHEAPTPLAAVVIACSRVTAVEGRRVWFDIVAEDPNGHIASGRHARFVVDEKRFRERVSDRSTPATSSLQSRKDRG